MLRLRSSISQASRATNARLSSSTLRASSAALGSIFDESRRSASGIGNFARTPAKLVLEDGTEYAGYSFGAAPDSAVVAETVFNTGMVGYNENLTDPSYRGQFLSLTYPLIGNYGVPSMAVKDDLGLPAAFESSRIQPSALLVANYEDKMSHWRADRTLDQWLKDEGIPGLTGIDTRALTKRLRSHGSMLGKIVLEGQEDSVQDLRKQNPLKRNLAAEVSVTEPVVYNPSGDVHVVAVDCGIKYNIIRHLCQRGAKVTLVPWNYDYTTEMRGQYDGVFVSNGPGDPALLQESVGHLRAATEDSVPIFGICMGNLLLGQAAGGQTYKLPYGNRGQNIPCMDTTTGQVYITPQNHGYAIDPATLAAPWEQLFVNTNDLSNEGVMHTEKPFFSAQFHPEANGGPEDTAHLFDRFLAMARAHKRGEKTERQRQTVASKDFDAAAMAEAVNAGGRAHSLESGRREATRVSTKKVLILGSGGLQIGQAGEFDYSGSQAIKALREEGIETVLINPNIATIQTGKGIADKVYFLPVTTEFVEEVIAKERPDGILLGFGGQTGLNTGVELSQRGILEKHGVQVLGTTVDTIMTTEDRQKFNAALDEINQPYAPSKACETIEASLAAADEIGYPVICRAAYALGGLGSGFADDADQLRELVHRALSSSPQVLIEKSVRGWKEVEYEVVRDAENNCLTVCNMENFDPMGIHTGESIVVAPSQTLDNREYHMLRTAAIDVVRHLGIIGECNIQYTLDPKSLQYYIIEVNPRLSRSSALASKATGYPLAAVAAKLSLGITLPEVRNAVTQKTKACFEPSLDYCVVKMPKWDLKKFTRVSPLLGSSMKSVGEVMAIGRSFEEALQKAIRMNDMSNTGFEATRAVSDLDFELTHPSDLRIFALRQAMDLGYSVDRLHDMTKIDRWFLEKLAYIRQVEAMLRDQSDGGRLASLTRTHLQQAKAAGFSDAQIAKQLAGGTTEDAVRARRKELGVVPAVKQIDTLAGEFPAQTNYLYATYNGTAESDVPRGQGGVMTLGSGVYRIGSSVEFDYCAVSAIRSLRRNGKRTITVNYNPETVSTDYDESDALYFEELSHERVLDLYEHERADGVIVSVGGQQPNNIAMRLHESGTKILGTSAHDIDRCEDRQKYSAMLDRLGIDQPAWAELASTEAAYAFATDVGYPVLVRPSYVLSGAAMNVAKSRKELEAFLAEAKDISAEHPVVISKFIEGAREVEVDAVAQNGRLVNWAVAVHIENAGVHSGDASHVFPSGLPEEVQARALGIVRRIAGELQISGPQNTQFLLEADGNLKVIETNLRASRSFPFISKVVGVDFIDTATRVFLGHEVEESAECAKPITDRVCVKAPQFSFQRLDKADPVLGVEMASTGEVACFGRDADEAFLKAMISTNAFKQPRSTMLLSGAVPASLLPSIRSFVAQGFTLYACPEVQELLAGADVPFTAVENPSDDGSRQGCLGIIKAKEVDIVVNIPFFGESEAQYLVRRTSADFGRTLCVNEKLVDALARSLEKYANGGLKIEAWDEYFPKEHPFHST